MINWSAIKGVRITRKNQHSLLLYADNARPQSRNGHTDRAGLVQWMCWAFWGPMRLLAGLWTGWFSAKCLVGILPPKDYWCDDEFCHQKIIGVMMNFAAKRLLVCLPATSPSRWATMLLLKSSNDGMTAWKMQANALERRPKTIR